MNLLLLLLIMIMGVGVVMVVMKVKVLVKEHGDEAYNRDDEKPMSALCHHVRWSQVLNQTEDLRRQTLIDASGSVRSWLVKVKKLKAIFHTLNSFNIDITDKYLIGECWVPISHWDRIEMALHTGAVRLLLRICISLCLCLSFSPSVSLSVLIWTFL